MTMTKTAVEQPTTTVVPPIDDTTQATINGLREDIKAQYHVQEGIARIGFATYLRNHGVNEFPEGQFSAELQKLIYESAERYPFSLRPTELTGIDDGNTWLDYHPIPCGYESEDPYVDFLDEMQRLERLTRYRLKLDTMEEHGHNSRDVSIIESIGECGHICVDVSPEERLQGNEITPEEFAHLKQTAIDYFKYRCIWLDPKHVRDLDDEIFDIRIIDFFNRGNGGGGGGNGDREERELLEELTHFSRHEGGEVR